MNSWSRLEQVINWSELTVSGFAQSIGLKRAENLYQIKKGKNSVSMALAELIVSRYGNISKSWLITGEGSMFTDKNAQESLSASKGIPFYSTIFRGEEGNSEIKFPKPLFFIEVPSLLNCDYAITCLGDSMAPDIPSGSIVTLKEIDISSLLPGEMYLVVTDDYSTFKRVRTSDSDHLRLISSNNAYDEAVMKKSMIRHLSLVKGVISIKVL